MSKNPDEVYLQPNCGTCHPVEWAERDVWGDCPECGSKADKYVKPDAAPFDIIKHLRRQFKWSQETFGPPEVRGYKGPLAHLRKELTEIEAAPDDLEEWADGALLLFDGAMRAGHSPEDFMAAIAAKFDKNQLRIWPDWRSADPDKPIEHVRGYHD
ncbi:hypothetical protein [Sinorhizobium phage phiM5]|nr:hypothetical protein [Sinorhizobium phage phiM5]